MTIHNAPNMPSPSLSRDDKQHSIALALTKLS